MIIFIEVNKYQILQTISNYYMLFIIFVIVGEIVLFWYTFLHVKYDVGILVNTAA